MGLLDYKAYFFPHRLAAALLAMSDRCLAVSAFARALPPLAPPSFPSATAAGLRVSFGSGGALPVAMSTTIFASWFGSRGIFERLSMPATVP